MTDGLGYRQLLPNAAVRSCIVEQDRAFARELVAHNIQCMKDAGCVKVRS
ncbi:MAG: hypothetical protein JJ902_05555 [Roseibium sp.]|nr:hypothetical protein [Roseibium sp.]